MDEEEAVWRGLVEGGEGVFLFLIKGDLLVKRGELEALEGSKREEGGVGKDGVG